MEKVWEKQKVSHRAWRFKKAQLLPFGITFIMGKSVGKTPPLHPLPFWQNNLEKNRPSAFCKNMLIRIRKAGTRAHQQFLPFSREEKIKTRRAQISCPLAEHHAKREKQHIGIHSPMIVHLQCRKHNPPTFCTFSAKDCAMNLDKTHI